MSIRLEHIFKKFGDCPVFNDLNLPVNAGEYHVILGPSGEGKTVLLKTIAGFIRPDRGRIYIHGTDVTMASVQERSVGLVFQDFALFPHLTVHDNIAFGLRAQGCSKKTINLKIDKYAAITGLARYLKKYPATLSGGQKQRVALARALALEPEVLLLDEPLGSLDTSLQEEIRLELKQIHHELNMTIIHVTHNKTEAFFLADNISIIHKGKIVQTETPEQLFYKPKSSFVAEFMGITNIFDGRIVREIKHNVHVHVAANEYHESLLLYLPKFPVIEDNESISFCIHPEKVILTNRKYDRNCLPGHVFHIISNGAMFDVIIDVMGHQIKATVPKTVFNRIDKDDVFVYFPPESFHPLCGKTHRMPENKRKCMNYAADSRIILS
ncbi:ABC transporter ATP-binding protein [candidate division KSB1 bacterium]|nr:ABC transporter ATP-binding protein [candidate division KSB1 bacterium]